MVNVTKLTFPDINEKSVDFRMGHPFDDVIGKSRKVLLNTTCNLGGDNNNVLTCHAVNAETGLKIHSVAVFSRSVPIKNRLG
jgi:hypothetical protein